MNKDKKKKEVSNHPKHVTRKEKKENTVIKLPEDMENDIRLCFAFYDNERSGYINRTQMRSILGNFSHGNMNVKEIEAEIHEDVDESKNSFSLQDIILLISKKWFLNKGRDEEIDEMFELFDKKDKNQVALSEIKNVFSNYLDIQISDADIMEFIQEADIDGDGYLNKNEFATKLGYF